MSESTRAVIFANGDLPKPEALRSLLHAGDVIIAADGGLKHVMSLGLQPALVVGDLDSAPEGEIARLEREGIQVLRYPRHKDETDLELALQQAIAMGLKTILVAGALGGRLDQTMGNLFLLSNPLLAGLDVRLEDGREEVFLIRSRAVITGQPGDVVSLLPLHGAVQGVETQGLEYPLRFEALYAAHTRGISNVMTASRAEISLAAGILICIHTRGKE